MANVRTLKLNLLGDVGSFNKSMKKASNETQSFSSSVKSSMKTLAKSAALAGVAVAGMAVAFGVDAVKAAIADQKSQKQLAVALKNTTKATDKQIASVEKYITKQQMQFGIADDKLRPALAKLTRATGDVTKAQDLLSLSLDVSAGTGKDLETVTTAIAKAQGGNLASLKKLGVPLSDTIIKTKDLAGANKILDKSYGGAAQANADTFAGKMANFNQAMGEAKESIGSAILEAIQPMAEKWLPILSAAATDMVAGFTGKDGKGGAYEIGVSLQNMYKALKDVVSIVVGTNKTGEVKTFAETMQDLANAIQSVVDAINYLKPAFKILIDINKHMPNLVTVINAVKGLGNFGSQLAKGFAALPGNFFAGLTGGVAGVRALGGPVSGGRSYLVGEHGPELFTPMGGGNITSNGRLGGGGVTIIMNGIVDGESARRSIERVLQQSSIRTGAINVNGVAL
jgi:hypothetical protein